jgi:type I restriction enzyme M protein
MATTKIKNAWNAAAIGQSLWGIGDIVNDLKTTAQQIGYFHEHILWLQTQFPKAIYTDVKGLCKAATQAEMAEQNCVLTPARYVGFVEIDESEEDFTAKIQSLQKTLLTQMQEANALDADIRQSLEQLNLT